MQYGNYSFVIDSSFRPFEMQEMLTPFLMYKDAFEKAEEAYSDISDKANTFEYLSKTLPEGSEARKLYEGYANTLKTHARDFEKNGLNLGNRRGLTELKRRYSGEIGELMRADAAMKEEKALRRQMSAKDPSMLYAADNLGIDQFLHGNTPNLYGISGNDLYAKGAQAGKSSSARVYSAGDAGKTLGGYYRDYVEKMGYTPEDLRRFGDQIAADFSARVSTLPELQDAANQILEANGVNSNLTGNSLRQAQQQVIRGIIDGAVYQESHKPVRDESVMSAAQQASLAQSYTLNGYEYKDGKWQYNPDLDPAIQKIKAHVPKPGSGSGSGSSSSGSGKTQHVTQGKNRVIIEWKGNDPAESVENAANYGVSDVDNDQLPHIGQMYTYDDLPEHAKELVKKRIGDGRTDFYDYYYRPFESGWRNDTEAALEIVPRDVLVDDAASLTSEDLMEMFSAQ